MNEQEFIAEIEKQTGKQAGKDFGFIMGTQTPFISSRGMMSQINRAGYIVWKKEEKHCISKGVEENLKEIVEFLK